jgi:uncharacterized protein YbcI
MKASDLNGVEGMAAEGAVHRGAIAAAISNGLVALHKRYYGKGPTKAKTYLVNDTVVCMLREGFTTVEKTLADSGKAGAVENVRRSFQEAMEPEFRKVVEDATGRQVIAYMSQIHCDPDISLEVFVLEPGHEPLLAEHELELQLEESKVN